MMMIRPATPADRPRLFDIWRDAVEATHDFLSSADFDAIAVLVRDDYLPAADFSVVVDADDRPLGFLGATGRHVDSLFIDPAVRGRGIGRTLLAHVGAIADAPLTVDVNEQNGQAVGFYERMGFAVTSRSPTDDQGRPYPLLHMSQAASPIPSSESLR